MNERTKIELSAEMISRLERLKQMKYERRPGNIPLALFLEDMLRPVLEDLELAQKYPPILEEYSVEEDRVAIRDNELDKTVELSLRKDDRKLHCPEHKNADCVHVGFAWSIPRVRKLLGRTC